ncbi:MAG: hypothetical protein K9J30_11525 [Bacteroidales bacterium]|nr:hypothetical protein [Bacteroidales bacterium]
MKYLFKILWQDQSRSHLLWAVLGTIAGFVLLLSGIHFYENMKNVLSTNKDLLDPEYIIINKRVNISQTLGLGSAGFSEKEIREIEEQPFSNKVDPFISNEFPISAFTQSKQFPNFYTELFFEAVPDEYIDVKSDQWNWSEKKEFIPVILPQDYLNLYNFGFSQSQGLPQIPKEMIGLLQFQVILKGKDEKRTYPGKIIGFSNRINSILVPYDFLTWANDKFGYMEQEDPSRIILVSNDPTDPAIIKFIEDKGYDTIREKLKSSRLNIILKFVLSFLVAVAAIIIGLAFLIFLLSLQLMISRSAEKIRRLNKLGYHHREISHPYIIVLFGLLMIVTLFSIGITSLIATKLSGAGMEWSLPIEEHLSANIYLVSTGLVMILFALNTFAISLSTRKLCS